MRIMNLHDEPYNFDERLKPLFEAMSEGQIIKSVTCFSNLLNKDNRDKDYTIKNFSVDSYWVAALNNTDHSEKYDFVFLREQKGEFFMNWVIDFEL